jgi:ABC-type uncharacterized transport system permease subunit
MSGTIIFNLLAVASILPATFVAFNRQPKLNGIFWATLIAAIAGPVIWLVIRSGGVWHSDFSSAIWITVAFTLVCYGAVTILTSQGWQLASIIMPYMTVLAVIAAIWDHSGAIVSASSLDGTQQTGGIPNIWVIFHILVSIITYAVVTTGACAALAGVLKERALKNKKPTVFTQNLPSMADCDELQFKLLGFAELVLGLGLITGMAATFTIDGSIGHLDHKTILAVLAFVVIAVLLILHRRSGVRGRQAARLILAAYLLLTLAYPGVKFVTDVLLAS